jgi:Flp pilus assembly pilin Flp
VAYLLSQLWHDEQGQDIAEYAVMLAVILVIVVGTVRLIGSNANTVFSQVGSAIQLQLSCSSLPYDLFGAGLA